MLEILAMPMQQHLPELSRFSISKILGPSSLVRKGQIDKEVNISLSGYTPQIFPANYFRTLVMDEKLSQARRKGAQLNRSAWFRQFVDGTEKGESTQGAQNAEETSSCYF
jgi:hypothetical protein